MEGWAFILFAIAGIAAALMAFGKHEIDVGIGCLIFSAVCVLVLVNEIRKSSRQ